MVGLVLLSRLIEIEKLPHRIAGEAERDDAPERRAGGELDHRPDQADGEDCDAPPQRLEEGVLVIFHRAIRKLPDRFSDKPAATVNLALTYWGTLASRPCNLRPSSPASVPCGRLA